VPFTAKEEVVWFGGASYSAIPEVSVDESKSFLPRQIEHFDWPEFIATNSLDLEVAKCERPEGKGMSEERRRQSRVYLTNKSSNY
jgi:hypothetical protein